MHLVRDSAVISLTDTNNFSDSSDRFMMKAKLIMYEGKLWAETSDLMALSKKHIGMIPLKIEGQMERPK